MRTDGCKVEIATDRYDLDAFETLYDSVDERLLARWTGAPSGTRRDQLERTLLPFSWPLMKNHDTVQKKYTKISVCRGCRALS